MIICILYIAILYSILITNYNNDNNNKPKASPLRGTSDMEHTHPLTHKKTHKQDSEQKFFNLQPLQISQNLAQHLQVSVVRIHPTPSHTVTSRITSFISELNHSAYFIAEPCLDILSWNLKLPDPIFQNSKLQCSKCAPCPDRSRVLPTTLTQITRYTTTKHKSSPSIFAMTGFIASKCTIKWIWHAGVPRSTHHSPP